MKKGFTLIESLVAVTILMVAAAGPLFAANRAIVAAGIARDRLTASLLSQEGTEYIRLVRDNKYLQAYQTNQSTATTNGWSSFITAVANCDTSTVPTNACKINPTLYFGGTPTVTACVGGACGQLYLTAGGYTYDSSGTQTKFIRSVQVAAISSTEEVATSTVAWSYRGTTYSVVNTLHLTQWQ
ncbi:MAG: hypothetical protein JWN18_282 [Parcubacteria group bacterium]|nr:hypothetical protein [Parcubacteria group bacterium]